ncbi:MAG: tRNA lysidine(34) synthetase TilS [Muribaculum sp.]|nr:tRNA lysidine(34) synthetase TilS [Muribaculum sp.]
MKNSDKRSRAFRFLSKVDEVLSEVPDGVILATVSGGADSVALLTALRLCGREVTVANCNFHLRGQESDRDSRFVADLCRRLGVELCRADFQAAEYSLINNVSIEMACRELRHEWFARMARKRGAVRIATGHNRGDNIETMLMNLLRGSGSAGLKGMTVDNGKIVRPLLNCTREEILGFLADTGQDYVTDSTNLESDYRRNFLRNEVLPLLRSRWEGADKGLARSIELMAAENKIVERAVREALSESAELLTWERIRSFVDAETLIFRYIEPYGGSPVIAAEISRSVASPRAGSVWRLKGGVYAVANADGLSIERDADEASKLRLIWKRVDLTDSNRERIMRKVNKTPIEEAWLPYPPEAYVLRKPEEGERFEPLGMKGSKLISDILREAGVSVRCRQNTLMLCRILDNKPIWIPGVKRSRYDLVDRSVPVLYHVMAEAGE